MKNIVVLASGSGTNLQRIIESIDNGQIPDAKVVLVVADRECYALERAKKQNIPSVIIIRGKSFFENLERHLPEQVDLFVLAGFLSILTAEFCEKYKGKIINIHPSLLPKYGGKGMWGHHVHEAVLNAHEKESGATVHFVTVGIDEGKIILQKSFPISPEETLESLAEKVHKVEYEILPKAIAQVLSETLDSDRGI